MESVMVKISDIDLNEHNRRPINQRNVKKLAESIEKIGLINPVMITKDNKLVAGLHRVKAYEFLTWKEISCIIVDFPEENSELMIKLAEIDENLIRTELHYSVRGDQLKMRKEIYEKLYPETKHGGDRKSGKIKSQNPALDKPSFVEDVASQTGKSKSTIKEELFIAENLIPDAKPVIMEKDIPKSQASKLARMDNEAQKAIVKGLKQGTTTAADLKELNHNVKKVKITSDVTQYTKNSGEQIAAKESQESSFPEEDIAHQDTARTTVSATHTLVNMEKIEKLTECKEERFDVIYADLSSTISPEEIKNLQVLFADNAVLFLWSTPKDLIEKADFLKTFGCKYETHFVLPYDSLGAGQWNKKQHDLLVLGIKGNFEQPKQKFSSIIKAEGVKIGMRPVEVQEMIEKMYPNHTYLGLHLGSKREGWVIRTIEPLQAEDGVKKEQSSDSTESEKEATQDSGTVEDEFDALEEDDEKIRNAMKNRKLPQKTGRRESNRRLRWRGKGG